MSQRASNVQAQPGSDVEDPGDSPARARSGRPAHVRGHAAGEVRITGGSQAQRNSDHPAWRGAIFAGGAGRPSRSTSATRCRAAPQPPGPMPSGLAPVCTPPRPSTAPRQEHVDTAVPSDAGANAGCRASSFDLQRAQTGRQNPIQQTRSTYGSAHSIPLHPQSWPATIVDTPARIRHPSSRNKCCKHVGCSDEQARDPSRQWAAEDQTTRPFPDRDRCADTARSGSGCAPQFGSNDEGQPTCGPCAPISTFAVTVSRLPQARRGSNATIALHAMRFCSAITSSPRQPCAGQSGMRVIGYRELRRADTPATHPQAEARAIEQPGRGRA